MQGRQAISWRLGACGVVDLWLHVWVGCWGKTWDNAPLHEHTLYRSPPTQPLLSLRSRAGSPASLSPLTPTGCSPLCFLGEIYGCLFNTVTRVSVPFTHAPLSANCSQYNLIPFGRQLKFIQFHRLGVVVSAKFSNTVSSVFLSPARKISDARTRSERSRTTGNQCNEFNASFICIFLY